MQDLVNSALENAEKEKRDLSEAGDDAALAREIVLDALLMAIWRRKPDSRVLIHSDQGTQYGSDDWQRFCREHNLDPSMSRRGNCWDNAVAESFFSSLKKERIKKRVYKTRDLR